MTMASKLPELCNCSNLSLSRLVDDFASFFAFPKVGLGVAVSLS